MFDQLSGAENNNNNNSGEWILMNIKLILVENEIRDFGLVLFKAIINSFVVLNCLKVHLFHTNSFKWYN